jgi:LCP family protein required for cell wall assembly
MLRVFVTRFVTALVLCVTLAAGGVAGAYWFANNKWDDVTNANIPQNFFAKAPKGKPANYLIIGSDTRSFVNNSSDAEHFGSAAEEGGQRSDTIMVAHIDPASNSGMLVSFPRDLKVNVPGRGFTRINSAFSDSPATLIQTLKDNFNIPIHHYLEVDFAGFRELVDAVGGVPIYFTSSVQDVYTGLRIGFPGCYTLNGGTALAYVRSRHWQYKNTKDDVWHEDPYSDLGRIARQQYFIRSLAQIAINTAAKHPLKANNIMNKAFASLTKDRNLGLSDIKGLAATLRETDPAVVQMITLPNKPSGDGATLLVDDAKAAPVLQALRSFSSDKDKPSASILSKVKPSEVTVKVLNGSGVKGQARTTLDALAAAGFKTLEPPADASRRDYDATEVRYASGAKSKAQLVAAYLGVGTLVAGDNIVGSDVTVVLGRDFEHVTAPTSTPVTPAPAPTTGAATATTAGGPRPNPGQTPGVAPQPLVGCG